MREVLRWPNVERELRFWVGAHVPVGLSLILTETTVDLDRLLAEHGEEARGRYVTLERAGGRSDGPLDKLVAVEVAVHAADRGDMWELARDVESAMAALAANGTPGMYVDEVEETFSFASDPPPDQSRRRAIATYTLTVRPR